MVQCAKYGQEAIKSTKECHSEASPRSNIRQVFPAGNKTKDVLLTGRRALADLKVQEKHTAAWKEEHAPT